MTKKSLEKFENNVRNSVNVRKLWNLLKVFLFLDDIGKSIEKVRVEGFSGAVEVPKILFKLVSGSTVLSGSDLSESELLATALWNLLKVFSFLDYEGKSKVRVEGFSGVVEVPKILLKLVSGSTGLSESDLRIVAGIQRKVKQETSDDRFVGNLYAVSLDPYSYRETKDQDVEFNLTSIAYLLPPQRVEQILEEQGKTVSLTPEEISLLNVLAAILKEYEAARIPEEQGETASLTPREMSTLVAILKEYEAERIEGIMKKYLES